MIPLIDLAAQYRSMKAELDRAIQQVLESGQFVMGANVKLLEEEVASYIGAKHAVAVASGTDALVLTLRAMGIGPGGEVIAPAYTFFSTVEAPMVLGARPRLIDIDPYSYCLDVHAVEALITDRTEAVVPVHLYGSPADMDPLIEVARRRGVKVIEDAAQAFGAAYEGQKTGGLGDAACLSFYPSKNLGAFGDGGMVVTNDKGLAEEVAILRSHGWRKKYHPEQLGYNSRLDELQAAILRVKLRRLDSWNARRRELAARYSECLKGEVIAVPYDTAGRDHVYHLYVIRVRERDRVQQLLKEQGIASDVYYPRPLHLTAACKGLGYQLGDFPVSEQASLETLAIPLFPEMTRQQQDFVIESLIDAIHSVRAAS